jgi:hypothetical protein
MIREKLGMEKRAVIDEKTPLEAPKDEKRASVEPTIENREEHISKRLADKVQEKANGNSTKC